MAFKTKEDYVADFLRENILSGKFPRGTRLKQAEVAKMLDISITPVREALRLLAAEGYVLGTTHRGAIVAPFEAAAAKEIMELRVMLESKLTLAAMQRMTAQNFDELGILRKKFEDAAAMGQRYTVRAANYRFHSYLHSLADLPQTLHFVQILWAKYPFDLINVIDGRIQRAAEEHADIFDALTARDENAVLRAVHQHIETGWQELKTTLHDSGNALPIRPYLPPKLNGEKSHG